ncbi:Conserved oligomeric Golgi complex subunit 2 [Manis javanica]|nr:Conserved oligomeric Golgi complex subunit 2 [Manis javanica]
MTRSPFPGVEQEDFDVDHFVSGCRKHVPLEELRDDLELDDELLKTAMVGLINKDYADFVTFQQTWLAWTKPSISSLRLWDSYEKRFWYVTR